MSKERPISDNGRIVLEFLQNIDRPVTGSEVAEATGLNKQGIHGVLNGLVKRNLVSKGDKVTMSVLNREGATEERGYVTYSVTDAGAEVIID